MTHTIDYVLSQQQPERLRTLAVAPRPGSTAAEKQLSVPPPRSIRSISCR